MFNVRALRRVLVLAVIAIGALSVTAPATAAAPKAGSYKGKITPTDASDSSSDTAIKFKVNGKGTKVTKMKAEFYYGCFIGGSFTLQYYVFPAFHKGPIKIKRNGSFAAKDVVDKQAGFVVEMKGKAKGSKATGTISLQTETRGNGCGRDFTFKARRK